MVHFKKTKWKAGHLNQYMAALAGSLCYTIAGTAIAWPSPTLIKMAEHETPLTLDVTEISWMVSLMFLGHLTSPLPSGFLMDWFGRKRTCLCMAILPFASWLLILFSQSAVHLYVARYAAGLWIGATTTIMPLYIGEIAEPRLRGSLTTINNLMLNLGVLFVYVVGPYVSYSVLAISCEVITLIYFCVSLTTPESPYFFVKHQQKEKALKALQWLRKGDTAESIENELIRMQDSLEEQKNQQTSNLGDIFFDAGNRKAFIISLSYSMLRRLCGAGVLQAYTSITLPPKTLGVLDPDECVIIIGFVSFLSSLGMTALAVRFRRTTLLTISCLGCAVTTATVGTWFYLNHYSSVDVKPFSDVIFLSVAVYYCMFNVGLGPIGASIKGEVFTPNVKGLASSVITLVVALSAFFVNKYYLIIAENFGMFVNYIVFCTSCLIAVIFTWTYVPEMHKKTLEEIHELLRGKSGRFQRAGSIWTIFKSRSRNQSRSVSVSQSRCQTPKASAANTPQTKTKF